MNVYEVDLQHKINFLLEGYIKSFREIFKKEPLITDDERSAVERLLRKTKLEKSEIIELMVAYLTFQDEWVAKQGYPLRLLESKYNGIIIGGRTGKKNQATPSKFLITSFLHCDSCWKSFHCDHDAQIDLQTVWIRCPLCLETNQPWKYPSKEEFSKNWATMGQKTPAYENIFKKKEPYPHRADLVYINAK